MESILDYLDGSPNPLTSVLVREEGKAVRGWGRQLQATLGNILCGRLSHSAKIFGIPDDCQEL